jgi:hypothetical protein
MALSIPIFDQVRDTTDKSARRDHLPQSTSESTQQLSFEIELAGTGSACIEMPLHPGQFPRAQLTVEKVIQPPKRLLTGEAVEPPGSRLLAPGTRVHQPTTDIPP